MRVQSGSAAIWHLEHGIRWNNLGFLHRNVIHVYRIAQNFAGLLFGEFVTIREIISTKILEM